MRTKVRALKDIDYNDVYTTSKYRDKYIIFEKDKFILVFYLKDISRPKNVSSGSGWF